MKSSSSQATQQFTITGMHCASCSKLLTMALHEVPGVQKADVSYPKHTATVTFDTTTTTPQTLIAAVKKAGYGATIVDSATARARDSSTAGNAKSGFFTRLFGGK